MITLYVYLSSQNAYKVRLLPIHRGYTIADMSVFAYISRGGEAGIDLTAYPAVTAWIQHVRSQANFLETSIPIR